MASISRDKNGTKRILFVDANKKRHTIRLGKVSVKAAESFKVRIESLISSHRTGSAIDAQTADWVATLPDEIHERLERAGLVAPRERCEQHTLGDLLKSCFESMSVKESTRTRYKQSRRLLFERFGEGRPLDDITPRDADAYRSWLEAKDYAPAKVAKEIVIARMFMKKAMRWNMIHSNPFDGVIAGAQTNRDRLFYLEPDKAHRLIDASPNADWRCIIALARFGGLRCPSEVLLVRWPDVDWANLRLRVRSPKTERHSGKSERIIPLFPELHAVLLDAFELADSGAEFVISGYRDANANLRTQLLRIIERTGLEPWPRLFNAMRASRATELAAEYPAAVCTSWMGHTQAVAQSHYHMVRDEDFDRASGRDGAESGALGAHNASQQRSATTSREAFDCSKTEAGPSISPVPASVLGLLLEAANGPGGTRTRKGFPGGF